MADDALARDAAARRRACTDFEVPLVVEAGAGSGKTSTLVARIVTWCLGPGWERSEADLGADAAPEDVARRTLSRVVAITFTDAAAAEMASRVGEWLARIERDGLPPELDAGGLPPAEVRARRARPLRAALDRLVVRTIHAFCRRLLAEHPLEAGLHPAFAVDADEERAAGVVREVLEHALPAAYEDPDSDLSRLAAEGRGPAEVEEALLALVGAGAPGDLLAEGALSPAAMAGLLGRLRAAASALVAAEAGRLDGVGGSRTADTRGAVLDAEALLAGDPPATPEDLAARLDALRPRWEDGKSLERLRDWERRRFKKGEEAALAGDEEELARAAGVLERVLRHALALKPEDLERSRRALAPLLAEVERELRRRGVETFAMLLRDASRLVAGEPRVAARVRRDVDQLLVDEFQDTDALQCELIGHIALEGDPAERPVLFLVGDPRQSIYGWRSADLRAYDDFVARVREAGGEVLHLTRNFRSLPAVLDEVRAAVEPLMQPVPGVQPPFQDLVAHRAEEAGEDAGRVEHWIPWAWDAGAGERARTLAGDANLMEAAALARDLRRRGEEGLAWKDAAVLFRGMTGIDPYLDALREAGVPYTVERDRRYYQRREVVDASALLRTVLDPHDHVALVAWLRSPSVGVPDAAWIPLWARRFPERMSELVGPDPDALAELVACIAEAARAVDPALPGLSRVGGWDASLAAAVETLARLRAAFEAEPADRFVEALRTATLIEATEASRFLGPYRVANLDQLFRDLRDDLEETGGDVPEVLRRVRRAVAEQAEVEEARPREAADDAVRVMSIHKAKGLDFRHVYLLQLHHGFGGGGSAPARVGRGGESAEYELFGLASLGFDRAAEQARRIEEAEQVRTLYVAMTRARDRLVVSGLHPAKGPPLAGSHARLLADRRGAADPEALMGRLAGQGASAHDDERGVRWWFPALEAVPASRARRRRGVPLPLGAAEVAQDARDLSARRQAADRHAARPFARAASDLSHEAARERARARRHDEEPAAGGERPGPTAEALAGEASPARDVSPAGEASPPGDVSPPGEASPARDARLAAAVGTAVHAVLERAPQEVGPEGASERARPILEAALASLLGEEERAAALDEAQRVLHAFAATPLWRELAALEPVVLGREVPVLLAPDPGAEDGAVGFVSGAVDLLYRDPESGEVVVADYKTDDVREPGALEERVGRYAGQGAAYVRAVQEALGLEAPPRFELWFLTAGLRRVVPPLPAAR